MTEKSTTIGPCKVSLLKTTVFLLGFTALASYAKLIDQTVATVGAHVITYRDVKIQSLVSFVIQKDATPDESRPDQTTEMLLTGRDVLITDYLIQEYLLNIQISLDIVPEDLAKLEKAIEKAKAAEFFLKNKIDAVEVSQALMRKLRLDRFYENQLSFRVNLNDTEIKAHYEKYKNSKFLSKGFSEVENIVRADLKKEKLQQEFSQWMLMQSKRIDIQRLPMPT